MSKSRPYAQGTEVATERSRAQIDELLQSYGATGFMYGYSEPLNQAMVAFEIQERRVKFILPLPDRSDQRFTVGVHPNSHKPYKLPADKVIARYRQAERERWRALVLCIKAKLESVESGIETFEEAFLPHIVMSNGRTIGETLIPDISKLINTAKMPPLLGAGGSNG